MASQMGEEAGAIIGSRSRLQAKVSPLSRIEIVTEGVFARKILDDPELKGIASSMPTHAGDFIRATTSESYNKIATPTTIPQSARLKTYHENPPMWKWKKSATAP